MIQDSDEQNCGLESIEIERHIVAEGPAQKNHERGDKKGDLHRRADSHADSQIHFIFDSHGHGCKVL